MNVNQKLRNITSKDEEVIHYCCAHGEYYFHDKNEMINFYDDNDFFSQDDIL
ncbi:MAG: hypothetical protein GF383_12625 [Candidatus Lokiarchaeota archaeon]|nr:hypothetical protein [Candidatus Lokiarchaeota archaeon]MBD3341903.1 hypothetical protein [Candidatus Lokiarchaeota archaeon]